MFAVNQDAPRVEATCQAVHGPPDPSCAQQQAAHLLQASLWHQATCLQLGQG